MVGFVVLLMSGTEAGTEVGVLSLFASFAAVAAEERIHNIHRLYTVYIHIIYCILYMIVYCTLYNVLYMNTVMIECTLDTQTDGKDHVLTGSGMF